VNDLQRFEKACRKWAKRFGLSDWRLIVERGPKEPDPPIARIYNHVDARVARVLLFQNDKHLPIDKAAKHELLHTLLADWGHVVGKRGEDGHPDCVKEEHRLIERLMNIIPN